MMKFFSPNLDSRGRLVRGIGGVLCLIAGLVVGFLKLWLGVALIFAGGFMLFEAVRGWCAVRACGIKTKY